MIKLCYFNCGVLICKQNVDIHIFFNQFNIILIKLHHWYLKILMRILSMSNFKTPNKFINYQLLKYLFKIILCFCIFICKKMNKKLKTIEKLLFFLKN